jgi:hypothetical protein
VTFAQVKRFRTREGFLLRVCAFLFGRQLFCFEGWLRHRMPNTMIDDVLLVIIIAGIALSIAYLRAEYVLYRGFKAAQRNRAIVQNWRLRAQESARLMSLGRKLV